MPIPIGSNLMEIPRLSPLKQIRRFCLHNCFQGQTKEVRYCSSIECPFWFLRFGRSPKRVINEEGHPAEQLFDPENFKEGAKFDPNKEVSSIKPKT